MIFWADLRERLARFGLELHPEKTRLLEFGRFADSNRRRGGRGKPESFDFLGFTHICGKKRNGKFCVLRKTSRKRLRRKLGEVKTDLRRRMHDPVPEVGRWLGAVLSGHFNYYGVPLNSAALHSFRRHVIWLWRRALSRRSQAARWDLCGGRRETGVPTANDSLETHKQCSSAGAPRNDSPASTAGPARRSS